jgi:L-threonylcarbamoyladenylate synthase
VIRRASDPAALAQAIRLLKKGGVAAFPTETVYGLGANALNALAVARIFEIKKRPFFDPLIVHVSSPAQARRLWSRRSPLAEKLIQKFWPGPLTLVLPKSGIVPDIVTAGLATVAVRMPQNKIALDLIRGLGSPIAAPSANLFGHTSPTTAEAVWEDLGQKAGLILDGGPTIFGVESTVIKIENDKALLLRPGGVPAEEIKRVVPVIRSKKKTSPQSPGQLESHYAPWTKLVLMDKDPSRFLKALEKKFRDCRRKNEAAPKLGFLAFNKKPAHSLFKAVEILSPRGDLRQAAANLFEMIRKLDKMGLDLIVAQRVPCRGLGEAIMDRLRKASGGKNGGDCDVRTNCLGNKAAS